MSAESFGGEREEARKLQDFVKLETIEEWNKQGYAIAKYGNEFSVVMLGETHNVEEEQTKQLELIEVVKPQYVLHEFLTGWIYNPTTRTFEKQNNRTFDDRDQPPINELPPSFISSANRLGFEIVGCDLTQGELTPIEKDLAQNNPERYVYDEKSRSLRSAERPTARVTAASPAIVPFRDELITRRILEYHGKSSRPLVVIFGASHGRNIHEQKLLQDKGLGYIFADQKSVWRRRE